MNCIGATRVRTPVRVDGKKMNAFSMRKHERERTGDDTWKMKDELLNVKRTKINESRTAQTDTADVHETRAEASVVQASGR